MFELPELVTLAEQLRQSVGGKRIRAGSLGNSPHKFVWYNRSPDEFRTMISGKSIAAIEARGKWLILHLDPGLVLLIGECGGKLLYQPTPAELPDRYHLLIEFEDGSSVSLFTQMWGAMELHAEGEEKNREYLRDMRPTPVDREFTLHYFEHLLESVAREGKRSVKFLLTQHQLVPGVGNSIAQEIMFRSGLDPRHNLAELDGRQIESLYDAVVDTIREAIAAGGRSDEFDLHGRRGGFVRTMDSTAVGRACPNCGTTIERFTYLGGTCYVCPSCQR